MRRRCRDAAVAALRLLLQEAAFTGCRVLVVDVVLVVQLLAEQQLDARYALCTSLARHSLREIELAHAHSTAGHFAAL